MARQHDPPPRVSIHPTSFNESSTLGRTAQLTNNPTSDQIALGIQQVQNVVFWQGHKTEAQALTVDIGTVLPPTPTPHLGTSLDARPFAEIQYGVDGNIQNTVQIDVGTGRRLTVVANYVSVTVGLDPLPAGRISPVLTYGASIGTFAAPSQAPLVRSVYVDDLAIGTHTDFLSIPRRASLLLVPTPFSGFGSSAFAGTITILFFDVGGRSCGAWAWNFTTGLGLIPVVVPPDAFFFNVGSTVDDTSVRVPFQLSL